MKNFRPMLAVPADDLDALAYPLYASVKLDGIRVIITPDGPRTRKLKAVPNRYIAGLLAQLPSGLDGEVVVLDDKSVPDFRATTSAVMCYSGAPEFGYYVFDDFGDPSAPFVYRMLTAQRLVKASPISAHACMLEQKLVYSTTEVHTLFAAAVASGYEGLILRSPQEPYKFGRSTLREAGMLKVKPWADFEAKITGLVQEFENTNEQVVDERGYAKRTSHKAGKVARECMGTMIVASPKWPKPFEIGTGFTRADKEDFWARREELVGQLVKFKYVDVGGYDVPRHAVFLGFRAEIDT